MAGLLADGAIPGGSPTAGLALASNEMPSSADDGAVGALIGDGSAAALPASGRGGAISPVSSDATGSAAFSDSFNGTSSVPMVPAGAADPEPF